jgi:hypothetical protein
LPWHSSVHSPCCLGQPSGVVTFDSAVAVGAVAAVVVAVAVGHTATLDVTATMATVVAGEVATFGSKGSHRMMVSGDVADPGPDPYSSTVTLGALDQTASVAAWLKPETPLGFAGWGNPSTTEASSES